MKTLLNKKNFSVFVSSLATLLVTIFPNRIYDYLSEIYKNSERIVVVLVFIGCFFVFLVFVSLLIIINDWLCKKIFKNSDYNEHLQEAFVSQKAMFAQRQKQLQEDLNLNQEIQVSQTARNIQFAIECCYSFFEKSYTDSNSMVNDIRFEVTFMTKSYKDGGIIIPYSCNRERRQPSSMLSRDNNPNLYEGTETDQLYKEYNSGEKPKMRLIEDTKRESNYKEVYEGQTDRIRSTIIFPVFSHKNELLGTIVVHCDKVNFFKKSQYRFWAELMEIFSVDIGYFKILLDYLQKDLTPEQKPF